MSQRGRMLTAAMIGGAAFAVSFVLLLRIDAPFGAEMAQSDAAMKELHAWEVEQGLAKRGWHVSSTTRFAGQWSVVPAMVVVALTYWLIPVVQRRREAASLLLFILFFHAFCK